MTNWYPGINHQYHMNILTSVCIQTNHNHVAPWILTFLVLWVLLHRVEKIPSVQSLVATSSRPNIWGAVIALGFILSSLWGSPQSVIAFISMWIHLVFPAPVGPRVIIPCRTRWVSNSWISFRIQGAWKISPVSSTYKHALKFFIKVIFFINFDLSYQFLSLIFFHN